MKTPNTLVIFTSLVLIGCLATVHGASRSDIDATNDGHTSAIEGVEIAGSLWHSSLNQALLLATKLDKPVLHLQMFGRLDDEFC